MKPFTRSVRVGALIQERLSELLKKSIQDPRLASASITGVEMTADLKIARVFFVTGDRAISKTEAAAGFEKAKGYIKYSLAQQLNLRYMPEFQFYYDESIDYGFHIDSVLKEIQDNDAKNNSPTDKEP
jgi:ribosome-binding factor A